MVFEGPCKGPINFAVKGFAKASADLSTLLIRKYGLAFDTSTNFTLAGGGIFLGQGQTASPGDSPNTDGIHIGSSTGIKIYDSLIGTGDDCVSLSPESENILVSNVVCGPGHGISVGNAGTDNGVRIKTWPDSYEGVLSNFTFEDIVMNNVQNPIVIGQEYYPYNACNKKVPSKVKISSVKYNNIRGTL
ncbi:polygalacturonase-like [Mangifera indica]|uniref:polygalacturonase-like n=1 Tax=Mangifera indica TaxID=29780 RepID=UPI001CFB6ECC|nr:polygalacturonase-like [Mangifera indica]